MNKNTVFKNFNRHLWIFDPTKKPYVVRKTQRDFGMTKVIAEADTLEEMMAVCKHKIRELSEEPVFTDDALEMFFWSDVLEACELSI